MTWADTIGNAKTLDAWRRDVRLVFDGETAEALNMPFSGRPLAINPDQRMIYGQVDGVTKPVSRIVLGSVMLDIDRLPYSFALLDFFFERGGNCIDTAWIYRQGGAEKCVGAWIQKRGIREKIALIGKGAAPIQYCTPALVTSQLMESLERLQTDYVDVYLIHRDNPQIPVGEFVECLNQHYRAGHTAPSAARIGRSSASRRAMRTRRRTVFVGLRPVVRTFRWPSGTSRPGQTALAPRIKPPGSGIGGQAWPSSRGPAKPPGFSPTAIAKTNLTNREPRTSPGCGSVIAIFSGCSEHESLRKARGSRPIR